MKKLFTLAIASLFTAALVAAERTPSVTLSTSSDFEVMIDGKTYFSKNSANTVNIPNMQAGRHTIEVYEVKKKLFGKDRTLVNSSVFDVRDRDINIYVNDAGQIDVRETGSSANQKDRNLKNTDGNNSDRRSRGRGHKYGHNKEWKADKVKKDKEWKNKENRDDDDINDNDDKDDDDDDDDNGKNKPVKAAKNKSKGKGKS